MARSVARRRNPPPKRREAARARPGWTWISASALALTLALVIARMMMGENIRGLETMNIASDAPRAPGPATSLALDLLSLLPALLVLARRFLDDGYRLRLGKSMAPMALLAGWMALSATWADDRFAAEISAAGWCSAMALLWSTVQLVDSWQAFRLVGAAAFGLLLLLLCNGFYYRLIDWPDFKRGWEKDRSAMLADLNESPRSRQADQLGKNIESGVPMGFNHSANTYAALLVLTMTVGAGLALQRRANRDPPAWIAPIAGAGAGTLVLLFWAQSKGADASALAAAGGLTALWHWRDWIGRHARRLYFAGVAAFFLAAAAVLACGLASQSLPTGSLAFRWQYWVGAAGVFARHPFRGVGWENFGNHYLAHRLASAPEEVRDPHDFIVRFFVELGLVGGLLLSAWMLRLWWELCGPTPVEPALDPATTTRPWTAGRLLALTIGASAFAVAVSFDWEAPWAFLVMEGFKYAIFALALSAGTIMAAARSAQRPDVDDRPAPWGLDAVRLGLGLFLVHNLIDFSLFETGPMFLFALLVGAALGARFGTTPPGTTPSPRDGRRWAGAALIAGCAAWLAVAAGLALPTAEAEASAHDGDVLLRSAVGASGSVQSAPAAEQARRAALAYESASSAVPANSDYARRAADAWADAGRPDRADDAFARAIAADPSDAAYRFARARFNLAWPDRPAGAGASIREDFARALDLDPNNVAYRLEYADALARLGDRTEARRQDLLALDYNNKLKAEEGKRLSPAREAEVRRRIAALEKPAGQ